MVFSRTSQYAIQALIYIATQPLGKPILSRKAAEYLGVPTAYLAKIMQSLSKGNLLHSYRGRMGGFCLREGVGGTSLMQIVSLIEGVGFADYCVLGLKVCSNETPCPVHEKWIPIKMKLIELLQEHTVDHLAAAVRSGKYRICDLPAALLGAKMAPQGL
ncbi:MAG: Rrf2 family transcriptional regulator [Gallionellales bacterium GWA2_60_18]|nr:MAG: Rrf2 family transcriptional regulator [Gallionellales bacterium GWA2_60_18]